MGARVADDQAYLDTLKARRAKFAGIKSNSFADQQIVFDGADLDKEIARVERALRTNSGTRFATTSKGA